MTALKDHVEGVCRMRGAERLSLAELGVLIEDIDVVREERKEPAVEEPLTQDTPAPPVEPVLPPARPAINPALSLTYAGMVDSQQGLPDLNTLFSAEQRREFIERIFKQDSNHFASVIEALNNTLTWRDAALYLNRYFHVNGIDPLSKDVAGFSDVVQRRFTAEHTGSA